MTHVLSCDWQHFGFPYIDGLDSAITRTSGGPRVMRGGNFAAADHERITKLIFRGEAMPLVTPAAVLHAL